jgi:hypothetical protein
VCESRLGEIVQFQSMKAPRGLCTVAHSLWVISLFLRACVPRAETLKQSCNGGNVHDCEPWRNVFGRQGIGQGRGVCRRAVQAGMRRRRDTRLPELGEVLRSRHGCGQGQVAHRRAFQAVVRPRRWGQLQGARRDVCDRHGCAQGRRATAFFKRARDSTVILRINGNSQHWERMDDEASSQCVGESMDRARSSSPSRPRPQ